MNIPSIIASCKRVHATMIETGMFVGKPVTEYDVASSAKSIAHYEAMWERALKSFADRGIKVDDKILELIAK